jgi:oligoendopeptidase F
MPTVWNLTPLLNSDDDPQIETKRKVILDKSYAFINKWKDNKNYLKTPSVLEEALDEYEQWASECGGAGDLGFYFGLRSSQDENNPDIKAKETQIDDFAKKIANDMRFFTHRLAKVDGKIQEVFLTAPELHKYKHFLKKLFDEAKYLLSEEEEKIIMLKSGPAYSNWTRMTSAFLSKEERDVINEEGKKESKNFSEIIGLIDHTNKKVRDSAAQAFNDILEKYAEVAENELNSILQNKKIDDELRGLDRPDRGRHISDDIDTEVVDSLLETVSSQFGIAQKYYKLKAQLLGVKKLAYHERNIPYGNLEKKYTFEDSVELVLRVFNNLDPQIEDQDY